MSDIISLWTLLLTGACVLVAIFYGGKLQEMFGHRNPATWLVIASVISLLRRVLAILAYIPGNEWTSFYSDFVGSLAAVFVAIAVVHLYLVLKKYANAGVAHER
jgi:hypothetical protein